eukprot:gene45270-53477_t
MAASLLGVPQPAKNGTAGKRRGTDAGRRRPRVWGEGVRGAAARGSRGHA